MFGPNSATNRSAFRELVSSGKFIAAPGVYDAWSMRLASAAGFQCVYAGGFALAAAQFGLPDLGLLTATEVRDGLRRIAGASTVPVLADLDTGYGNALNVWRAVREASEAGVAAVHLEDQTFPKRCGHFDDKQVISAGDMAGKIRAARGAASDTGPMIFARTDALAVEGLDGVLARIAIYERAGAEGLFVDALTSEAEMRAVRASTGLPLIVNIAQGGRTPLLKRAALIEMGFNIAIYPLALLLAATSAIREQALRLHATGEVAPLDPDLTRDLLGLTGLPDALALARRYM